MFLGFDYCSCNACQCVVSAPCAVVQPWEAVIIGAIGGVLAILSVRLLDRLHIDDPVGAVSVHGTAGIWVSYTLKLGFS